MEDQAVHWWIHNGPFWRTQKVSDIIRKNKEKAVSSRSHCQLLCLLWKNLGLIEFDTALRLSKEDLKKKIEMELGKIENSLPGLRESARPVVLDTSIGRLSRMDAMGAQAIAQKSYQLASSRANHLKIALRLIGSKSFGVCLDCEKPIAEERLFVAPESRLCIRCAKTRNEDGYSSWT